MDYLSFSFLPWLLLSLAAIHLLLSLISPRNKKLPPGPLPLPIVGNLFLIGTDSPHESITELAKVHGPLMYLRLGSQRTVVVSSASMAKQVLHKNDASVCSRTVPDCITALQHHEFSFLFMPISPPWKSFRKICITQVFSRSRLDASQSLRRSKLEGLLSYVKLHSQTRKAVDIGQVAFNTSLNLLSNTFFSVDLVDPTSSNSCEDFKEVFSQILFEGAKPNLADYFPVFKCVDPQRIRHRMGLLFDKVFIVFNSMMSDRLAAAKDGCFDDNDALGALLKISHEDGEELPLHYIPHLLLELFIAGTDTSSGTIEWAMTELFRNPDKMKKARQELELGIGKGVAVKEEDFEKLPYLQAVIKETFRTHPAVPFIYRRATTDVEISGFTIPKDTSVIINTWAIGRDPSVWENPTSFEPERFLGCSEIDIKGRDFELIPFGSGRRICPGYPMAMRMIPLMLGSLINCFDWKLEDGVELENMDMSSKFGLSLQKTQPLRIVPITII